jgi:SPP1 gp7 family putative phage head morphogenesis protein
MMMDEYDPLSHTEKLRAFSYTGAASIEQVKYVFEQLGKSLMSGDSFKMFKDKVKSGNISLNLPDYRIENIFRTNNLTAKNRGRYIRQRDGNTPWLRYMTAYDDRVRPNHEALHDVIVRFGSKEADKIYPPNGYNCRCMFLSLSDEEAKAERKYSDEETSKIIEANPPDYEDFEGPPFEGKRPEDSVVPSLGELYKGKVIPDNEFKAALERLEGQMGDNKEFFDLIKNNVNESTVNNISKMVDNITKEERESFDKIRRTLEALGGDESKLDADEILSGDDFDIFVTVAKLKHADRDREILKRLKALTGEEQQLVGEEIERVMDEKLQPYVDSILKDTESMDTEKLSIVRKDTRTKFDDLSSDSLKEQFDSIYSDFINVYGNILSKAVIKQSKNKILRELLVSYRAMANLTKNERFLFTVYTDRPRAEIINKFLIYDRDNKNIDDYIDILNRSKESLKKMGLINEVSLSRGISGADKVKDTISGKSLLKIALENSKTGLAATVGFKNFSSYSLMGTVAKAYVQGGEVKNAMLMNLTTSNGVPITSVSAYPFEMERLVLPRQKITILKTRKNKKYVNVTLKDLNDK